jgi:hypothetical protein
MVQLHAVLYHISKLAADFYALFLTVMLARWFQLSESMLSLVLRLELMAGVAIVNFTLQKRTTRVLVPFE